MVELAEIFRSSSAGGATEGSQGRAHSEAERAAPGSGPPNLLSPEKGDRPSIHQTYRLSYSIALSFKSSKYSS
jgi:hypothetical protein